MKQTGHTRLLFSLFIFTGCTTAQVRWDAIGVREQVMKFYSDEVMDNLINMNKDLPYVHVDISTVSAAAASQVTGSVGGGNSRTFAQPGVLGIVGTISRSVTRPFTWSVSPLRSDTLTITAAPVIGTLSNDSDTGSSKLVSSKVTENRNADNSLKDTSTEFTPKPTPAITIYDIYERYGRSLATGLKESVGRPGPDEYVPGALKWRAGKFYYVENSGDNQRAYTKLCMALLKQGRGKSTGTATSEAVARTLNEFQDLKARESLPQTLTVPR
jgi:hypothetical protein